MSDELERYKIKVGLWKFVLGTVVLGVFTAAINYQIQSREIDLKQKEIELKDKEILLKDKDIERQELAQLGNYIDHAIQENIAIRRRFAQYFSTVSSSKPIRERWHKYYELVNGEYEQVTQEVQRLEKEQAKLASENRNDDELQILLAKIEALESELEVRRTTVVEESILETKTDNKPEKPGGNKKDPKPVEDKKTITAWTSWIKTGGGVPNPCPPGFTRGREIGKDTRVVDFPPRPQTKYKFECVEQQ